MAFLVMMLVCVGLIYSPVGAVLDADEKTIRLGPGYQITSVWYFLSFTFLLVLGYGLSIPPGDRSDEFFPRLRTDVRTSCLLGSLDGSKLCEATSSPGSNSDEAMRPADLIV